MTGPTSLRYAQDRGLLVPHGAVVRSGYAPVFAVRHACRDRMTPGDVAEAYQRLVQLGDAQAWPPPTGIWRDKVFELHDGRHEHLASIMLGHAHMLVAWVES